MINYASLPIKQELINYSQCQLKLSQIPFVRILLPFIAGIIIELNYALHFLFLYAADASLCFIFCGIGEEIRSAISYSAKVDLR